MSAPGYAAKLGTAHIKQRAHSCPSLFEIEPSVYKSELSQHIIPPCITAMYTAQSDYKKCIIQKLITQPNVERKGRKYSADCDNLIHSSEEKKYDKNFFSKK